MSHPPFLAVAIAGALATATIGAIFLPSKKIEAQPAVQAEAFFNPQSIPKPMNHAAVAPRLLQQRTDAEPLARAK